MQWPFLAFVYRAQYEIDHLFGKEETENAVEDTCMSVLYKARQKVDLLFTPALLHLRPAASQLLLPSKVAGKLHTHSVNLLQSLKVGVSSFE